ncbi:MAG TPA: lipopolysaccharide heptosyltransferase I [Pyrinomonadaceae bacterium]|nr:lipopolysaccharide heptosyltransferase I [Pyrinomonadaceae bacterium]
MKILIVKLGSIGDIIHTLPSLAAIRQNVPGAEISWVVESRSAEILRGNELIDRLIEVDTRSLRKGPIVASILPSLREHFRKLRRHKFDLAIDFQGLMKSAAIAKLSGAKIRYGFDTASMREPASRIFLNRSVEVPKNTNIIRKNLALAAVALGFEIPENGLKFPISTELAHTRERDDIVSGANAKFAILNPAGGWVTKLWPAENYGALADQLWEAHRISSIVAVGPDESELAARVLAASRSGKVTVARPSLKGFYELAKKASVYVGGDTGPTHLAIAAGAPVVGIFGPTEWWRNGSPFSADICVERTDIDCRIDCHRRTCSNWICMDISVKTVFDAITKRLGDPG